MTTLALNTPVTPPARLHNNFPYKIPQQTNIAQGSEGREIQSQLLRLGQPSFQLKEQQGTLKSNLLKLFNSQEINQVLYELSLEVWMKLSYIAFQMSGLYLRTPQVCAGSSNNLMYTWSLDQHYLECEIFDSGEVEFFYRNRSTGATWGEDVLFGQNLSREILQKANFFTV
jgi:hypothetical protein